MAKETVAKAETLKEFANTHTNSLYDVVALLDAAAERIASATPHSGASGDAADEMHNTMRLVQMAGEKAKALADLMFDKA